MRNRHGISPSRNRKAGRDENIYAICSLYRQLDLHISAFPNNYAYVKAVEELAGIEVPLRGIEYIRVLTLELNRIVNHLVMLWLSPS